MLLFLLPETLNRVGETTKYFILRRSDKTNHTGNLILIFPILTVNTNEC